MFEYAARVVSIHDGDTLRCDVDLGFGVWISRQDIRLAGIDAPELGTVEGRAARDWLRARLPLGSNIILVTHKDRGDKFGRYLGDLYRAPGDVDSINQQMIDAGHARPYDGGAR